MNRGDAGLSVVKVLFCLRSFVEDSLFDLLKPSDQPLSLQSWKAAAATRRALTATASLVDY